MELCLSFCALLSHAHSTMSERELNQIQNIKKVKSEDTEGRCLPSPSFHGKVPHFWNESALFSVTSQKIKKFANISKADQHCLSCLKPWSNEMRVDDS